MTSFPRGGAAVEHLDCSPRELAPGTWYLGWFDLNEARRTAGLRAPGHPLLDVKVAAQQAHLNFP
jgi:hypothetical protein